VSVGTRRGEPWIGVPKLEAQPEPTGLDRLKAEVVRRWGSLDLLGMVGEADHLVGLTGEFPSIATRQALPQTHFGGVCCWSCSLSALTPVSPGWPPRLGRVRRHCATFDVRRHFVNQDNLRGAIVRLVNATLAVRDPDLWGGGTACASDSKKFGSWDANLGFQ